ncbi:MAG: DUF4153 domain-containing protein [Planctomycetota bacterium]
MPLPPRRRLVLQLAVAAALVAAADFLVFRHEVGVNVALLVALFAAGMVGVGSGRGGSRASRVALGWVAAVVLVLVLEPTRLGGLLAALALGVLALARRHGAAPDLAGWLQRLFSLARRLPLQAPRDVRHVLRRGDGQPGRGPLAKGLRRWGPALGLGVVFLALFAVANPVLASWLEAAARRLGRVSDLLDPLRLLFWTLVGALVWGLLRTRADLPRGRPRRLAAGEAPVSEPTLVRGLLVGNALFALQNVLDVRHLVLGVPLPADVTPAAYAREGAWPLMIATLLAAGFVLAAYRDGAPPPGRRARRGVLVFLVQNVALTAFAITRLVHYVDAYSLTRWRVAALAWMVLVGVGLVLVAVRVLVGRTTRWLVSANAVAALGLLTVVAALPVDAAIAKWNVATCREMRGEGVALDVAYLHRLGAAAAPAWVRLAREAGDPELRALALRRREETAEQLRRQVGAWRTWTLYRHVGYRAATEVAAR